MVFLVQDLFMRDDLVIQAQEKINAQKELEKSYVPVKNELGLVSDNLHLIAPACIAVRPSEQPTSFALLSYDELRKMEKTASDWLVMNRYLQTKQPGLWGVLHGRYKYLVKIMGNKEPHWPSMIVPRKKQSDHKFFVK